MLRAQVGGTDSLSLGTKLETSAPLLLASDSPWFCQLQIYSLLFSWKPKGSTFKLSLTNCFVLTGFLDNLDCIQLFI